MPTLRRATALLIFIGLVAGPASVLAPPAVAQGPASPSRVVELTLRPTARAQIAVWIETADGRFMETVRLTEAVARRGIGNRPGAQLMNSGFRWPYGRREGVLPVWGHRRAAEKGVFPRVIFQDRDSEGFASRTSNDASRDEYYCLSFDPETTRREALDAVTCASVFNSDKGRYITENDVANGYAEPWEGEDSSYMRPLEIGSIYPARRDIHPCPSGPGCSEHPDVRRFADDVLEAMPNIDAVSMATLPEDQVRTLTFDVPPEWEAGDYIAYVEVNVEGDYNETFNDARFPTPTTPLNTWDYWAESFGYAYRGQPSVVYAVPFTLGVGGEYRTDTPLGYGDLHGQDGEIRSMADGLISDDPTGAPGSGADRLRGLPDGSRVQVRVVATNVCSSPEPPPQCGAACTPGSCEAGFVCSGGSCIGECDMVMDVPEVGNFELLPYPSEQHTHEWGVLRFEVPPSERPIREYEVRLGIEPIVDEGSFLRAAPALAAEVDSIALTVPTDVETGGLVEVEFGGMSPQATYYVGIRPRDSCNTPGPITSAELTTTQINFTTVSPCFVATAAYGSALEEDVGVLRRFRDRHLLTNPLGRSLVDAYLEVGPVLASTIRDDEALRGAARWALYPVVVAARWLSGDCSERRLTNRRSQTSSRRARERQHRTGGEAQTTRLPLP